MKESVTKFDLESAFKALDEIDVPVSEKGIKANKPALTEIFSRKSKFDSLFEEYYDIGSTEELGEAKEEREAEIAKAKLARIEKIVDLDADSPEDLLTSYVGKYIVQCPQCMTLFYKDKEDVVESEEDPTNVNVGEQCQHCGNESGYTLIGKVGEADQEEAAEMTGEAPAEETASEETPEEAAEETSDETADLDINLDDLSLEEPVEDEKKEESFVAHTGEALVEEVTDDKELDAKLEAHSEYIEYLRNTIAEEEAALEKTDNEQVKAAIQRRIDAFKADLEAALPDEVKNEMAADDIAEEPVEETEAEEEITAEEAGKETTEETVEESLASEGATLTEALHEEADLEVSADEFKELINSPEFKKPISDTAVRAMLNAEKDSEEKETSEVKESKSIYICDDCGCEVELDDTEYDGKCPKCGEHHGFNKLEEGIFDGTGLTRSQQADWVLKNAREDYNKSDSALAFNTFVIYYFKGNFRKDQKDTEGKGKKITVAPKPDNKDLVVGQTPDVKKSYKDASKLAAGWSMINGNGPAMILMAKNFNDPNKTFLCEYFKGELVESADQLATMIDQIKNSLKGMKKRAKANPGQPDFKEVKATEVKANTKIKYDNEVGTVTEVKESRDKKNFIFTVKFEDGTDEPVMVEKTKKVMVAVTAESLNTVMTDVEDLQENVLEKLISDSLVEAYGNVAGYRITGCEYLNEKLAVNGTAYFTSGNTRKLTYTFTEACNSDGKVELTGLNEKLGTDKSFTLTGRVENKTLITESFKCNNK